MRFYTILLILFIAGLSACSKPETPAANHFTYNHGAIIRGDSTKNELSLVFTGGDFGDGSEHIRQVLKKQKVTAAFFFTGDFYRNPAFEQGIRDLISDGHYLGAHSDKHLLYCAWENRDSLLVSKEEFLTDLQANYTEMAKFGIAQQSAPYFLPPYEWFNDSISHWTSQAGFRLINYTPGTLSHADYTIPSMNRYFSSERIFDSIISYEEQKGLKGFLLLTHIGTDPTRTDKFYFLLDDLIEKLKQRNYRFVSLDELLKP